MQFKAKNKTMFNDFKLFDTKNNNIISKKNSINFIESNLKYSKNINGNALKIKNIYLIV